MERRLTVHRIFPLGPYKNVQYTNEVVKTLETPEDTEIWENAAVGIYKQLTDEIYQAFFEHAKKIGKDITDFEEAYNNAGDTE